MLGMSDADARMRRGKAATEELEALREAVRAVHADLLTRIETSDPKDSAARESAYFELRALAAVVRKLQSFAAEGQLEESRHT